MPITPEMPLGQILAILGRVHAMRIDQRMEQVGLYHGQAILLLTLAKRDGLTHSEIARKLSISPAAASKAIKRMESLGYLQRTPDPQDERVSRVVILEGGREKLDDIFSVFQAVNGRMLQGISAEEQAELRDVMVRMACNLLDEEQPGNQRKSPAGPLK